MFSRIERGDSNKKNSLIKATKDIKLRRDITVHVLKGYGIRRIAYMCKVFSKNYCYTRIHTIQDTKNY